MSLKLEARVVIYEATFVNLQATLFRTKFPQNVSSCTWPLCTIKTHGYTTEDKTVGQFKCVQYILFSKQMMPFVLLEVLSLAFSYDVLS